MRNQDHLKEINEVQMVSVLSNHLSLKLSAGNRFMVELDAGELTTGYLHLKIEGGKGSKISILSSECYEKESPIFRTANKGCTR